MVVNTYQVMGKLALQYHLNTATAKYHIYLALPMPFFMHSPVLILLELYAGYPVLHVCEKGVEFRVLSKYSVHRKNVCIFRTRSSYGVLYSTNT